MLITYPLFYRKFGIRLLQQVLSPTFYDITHLELPQDSAYHYIDYDGITVGPAVNDYLFRNNKRIIPVEAIVELESHDGIPRRSGVNVQSLLNDYWHRHRQMKKSRGIETSGRDKQSIYVYDYALLGKRYHYQQSFYTTYFRWKNIFHTTIKTIARDVQLSNKNHFVYVHSPMTIPSMQQMLQASTELTQTTIKPFRDNNAYVLLELWKWLTKHREESFLSDIPLDKIHLVNIIFLEAGKWTVLNLGFLNSFRKPLENETVPKLFYNSKMQMDGIQLAKRILRLFMSVQQLKTLTAKNDTLEHDSSEINDGSILVEEDDLGQEDDDTDDDVSLTIKHQSVDINEKANEVNTLLDLPATDFYQVTNDLSDAEFKELLANEDKLIDLDLKQLEEIAHKAHEKSIAIKPGIEEVVIPHVIKTLDQPIKEKIDTLVADGVLSAGEHRRFERLSQSYKSIISPDGQTTLEEFIKINPETLKIAKPPAMADSVAVIDKTMLHSTLNDFTTKYVKEVLPKDTANMVMAIQNAGIAVTNYKVEKKADILGEHEEVIIKVSPVEGLQSTMRFKIPSIREDGTFKNNNVVYRVRLQRGD